jgi:hypothetical protein
MEFTRFLYVMEKAMIVYSPADDTTIIVLSMTLCITMCLWMICTVLRTQYELDTLKERYKNPTDSLQEQLHTLHQQLDTYKEESAVKFADLDRQCDLYRVYTYRVIELKEKMDALQKSLDP